MDQNFNQAQMISRLDEIDNLEDTSKLEISREEEEHSSCKDTVKLNEQGRDCLKDAIHALNALSNKQSLIEGV